MFLSSKMTCLIFIFFLIDKFLMQGVSKYYEENYHDT
jgi:hypothetical protein